MPKLNFEVLETSGPFTVDDRKELSAILGNKSVQRALGEILREMRELDRVSTCDLSGQKGLNEALEKKGAIKAMAHVVTKVLELGDYDNARPNSEQSDFGPE